MLNVRYLHVFQAVVKMGSISAAARSLHVSQPAVTKTIRQLEEHLDLELFLRVGGRLTLTPEAEQLVPKIERLFGTLSSIETFAQEIRGGFSGTITIAAVTTLSSSIVTKTIEAFQQDYPKVRFDIKALSTRHAVQYVATNHVDLGVLDAPPNVSDLDTIPLCRSNVSCIMHASHPLAQRQVITPRDLISEKLISFGNDTLTGLRLREAFHDQNIPFNQDLTVNNTITAYALVRGRCGVAIVDAFPALSGIYPDLVIRRFRPKIQTRPSIVYSKTKPIPIVARKFADELRTIVDSLVVLSDGLIESA